MTRLRSQRGHVMGLVLVVVLGLTALAAAGWSRVAQRRAEQAVEVRRTQLRWLARSAAQPMAAGQWQTTLQDRPATVTVTAVPPGPVAGEKRVQAVASVESWGSATVVVGTSGGKVTTWNESFAPAP